MGARSQSILSERRTISLSVRAAGHLYVFFRGMTRAKSRKTLVALGAASLALDLIERARLDVDSKDPVWSRAALDSLDSYLWSRAVGSRDVLSARGIQIVDAVSHGIERGYRFRAGRRAIPVVEPACDYPPSSARTTSWPKLLVPVLGPFVAASVAHRHDDRRPNLGQVVWGLMGVAGGFLVAQRREVYQDQIASEWRRRSASWIHEEREAASYRIASEDSPAHNFKTALAVLADAGSTSAARLASAEIGRTDVVKPDAVGGSPLGVAARAIRVYVEPESRGATWLSAQQVDQLRDFVGGVQAELGVGVDDDVTLSVEGVAGREVVVSLRGRRALLRHVRPRAHAIVDPTALALLLSSVWKATTAPLAGVNPFAAGVGAGIDAAGFARFVRSPPSEADQGVVLAYLVCSTAVVDLAIACGGSKERAPNGDVAFGATSATLGLLLTLGRYRHSLGRASGPLFGLAVVLWAAGAARTGRRHWWDAIAELCFLLMNPWATSGIAGAIEAEADLFEDELDKQLMADVEHARLEGSRAEFQRTKHQLDVAESELQRMGEGAIDSMYLELVQQRCREVRAWLEDRE